MSDLLRLSWLSLPMWIGGFAVVARGGGFFEGALVGLLFFPFWCLVNALVNIWMSERGGK
jgi:hypothetical protein